MLSLREKLKASTVRKSGSVDTVTHSDLDTCTIPEETPQVDSVTLNNATGSNTNRSSPTSGKQPRHKKSSSFGAVIDAKKDMYGKRLDTLVQRLNNKTSMGSMSSEQQPEQSTAETYSLFKYRKNLDSFNDFNHRQNQSDNAEVKIIRYCPGELLRHFVSKRFSKTLENAQNDSSKIQSVYNHHVENDIQPWISEKDMLMHEKAQYFSLGLREMQVGMKLLNEQVRSTEKQIAESELKVATVLRSLGIVSKSVTEDELYAARYTTMRETVNAMSMQKSSGKNTFIGDLGWNLLAILIQVVAGVALKWIVLWRFWRSLLGATSKTEEDLSQPEASTVINAASSRLMQRRISILTAPLPLFGSLPRRPSPMTSAGILGSNSCPSTLDSPASPLRDSNPKLSLDEQIET